MNKKIILGLSLVLIAVMAIGSASAFDFGSLFGGGSDTNQTVTIDGIDFNVPAGFVEDENQSTVNEKNQISGVNYTTNGKLYQKGETYVALLVADYGEYNVTDEIAQTVGGTPRTINNVNGYLTVNGIYKVFDYAKDGKLVVISTTDLSALEDFIIG